MGRAVAQRLAPMEAQLATVTRALGILADRVPQPRPVDELAGRVDTLAARLEELTPLSTAVASLEHSLRDELSPWLVEVVAQLEGSASTAVLGQNAAAAEQAVARIEAARAADTAALVKQVAALAVRAEADAVRRDEQAVAMLAALEAIGSRVAAEVHRATAAALPDQVEPLVARLAEALEALGPEGDRSEATEGRPGAQAEAVEERVAAMFVEAAERAERATDRSRARLAEGQVALAARFDTITEGLLSALSASNDRLEGRLAERIEELRAASGHQNGALLDAVNRSSHHVGEGLAKVRSDPRIEALLLEQVAARDAQLEAIDALSSRMAEVGPLVARALLGEVERATRSANAAEEAVAQLQPEALRAVLSETAQKAAGEVEAVTGRLEEAIDALPDELDRRLAVLAEAAAAAVDVTTATSTAIADLRASQLALREAVDEGAHKAELAAGDLRSLRDRLSPHLVALAEATSRRADADQAGFDAVLARLDRLLGERQR